MSDIQTSPRARRRLETTAEILAAAWRLARRDGLASISMRDLGTEVGLRAQSLYAYFGSKAELYDAMFRQGQEQFAELLGARPTDLSGSDDPRSITKEVVHDFVAFCTADHTRYHLLFQRVIPDWEPTPETYALAVARVDDLRRTFASLGIESPELVDLFTAIVTGLTDQQISNDPGGDRWIRLVDRAVDMFFDHAGLDPSGSTSIEETP